MSVSAIGVNLLPRPSVGWLVGQSVYRLVGPESVLWQNSSLDPDAILCGELNRSTDGYIR